MRFANEGAGEGRSVLRRVVFWAPRGLSIAFTVFVSMFALDVFGEGRSVGETLAALFIHLIPTYILLGMLVIAWRRGWVGAAVCFGLGMLFLWWNFNYRHNVTSAVLLIAGPVFLMAGLFLASWLTRSEGGAAKRC